MAGMLLKAYGYAEEWVECVKCVKLRKCIDIWAGDVYNAFCWSGTLCSVDMMANGVTVTLTTLTRSF